MSVSYVEEIERLSSPEVLFSTASFPEKAITQSLAVGPTQVIKILQKEILALTQKIMESPNVESFRRTRKASFETFTRLALAISNTVLSSRKFDINKIVKQVDQDLRTTEKSFRRENALHVLGEQGTEEALFLISTFRKGMSFVPTLTSMPVPTEKKKEDWEIEGNFNSHALWSQFHLTCLKIALSRPRTPSSEILGELLDGLRHSVMTYAFARQALELRGILENRYAEDVPVSLDAEDQAWIDF